MGHVWLFVVSLAQLWVVYRPAGLRFQLLDGGRRHVFLAKTSRNITGFLMFLE